MSLISLTFGDKAHNASPHTLISTPEERINQRIYQAGSAKGEAIVKRACRFYSQQDVYIVAQITEGFLSDEMTAFHNGKQIDIVDVESKFGHSAEKGMTVGLTVKGISENELGQGTLLTFEMQ